MSFTSRIISGNAVIVVLAVLVLTLLNRTGNILNALLIGLVLLAGSSAVLWYFCQQAFKPLTGIVDAMERLPRATFQYGWTPTASARSAGWHQPSIP